MADIRRNAAEPDAKEQRMYVEGTAAKLAMALMNDGASQLMMTGKICYDAVLHCLRLASDGRFHTGDNFMSPDEALRVLFTAVGQPVQRPTIRADCVVGILRKQLQQQSFGISHVMLSIDGIGGCIGSNNGAIGGPPNWNRVDIAQRLTWRPQRNPIYNDPGQPQAPEWAKERVVLVKPVRDLLTMV